MPVLKHRSPCKECPFRRTVHDVSLWGEAVPTPTVLLGETSRGEHTCHMTRTHEGGADDPACAGGLLFMRQAGIVPLDADQVRRMWAIGDEAHVANTDVFASVQEFIDHHLALHRRTPTPSPFPQGGGEDRTAAGGLP